MRVRGPEGTVTLQAEDDWTLEQLVALVKEKTGIPDFTLKTGFPPAPLDLTAKGALAKDLKLNGATLTLVPNEQAREGLTIDGATSPRKPNGDAVEALPSFKPKRVAVDETVVEWDDAGGYLGKSFVTLGASCVEHSPYHRAQSSV